VFSWLFKKPVNEDNQLQKYITTRINKNILFPIVIPSITKYCGTGDILAEDNVLSIYCWNIFNPEFEYKKIDELSIFRKSKNNTAILCGVHKLVIITPPFEYQDIADIIEEVFSNNETVKNNIDHIRYSIESLSSKIQYDDIMKKYPSILNNLSIIINVNVTPDHFYFKEMSGLIPDNNRTAIREITIKLNPMGQLLSVKLDITHPNADNHLYYCIGSLKFQYFDLEILEEILKRLKLYNLDDCYKIPDYLKTMLNIK
jgi:hypothetical protein